jgi:metal-sulfur cluster biosynthetic enzyme
MTATEEQRASEALAIVNDIVDPCSGAAGAPVGIGDMGIVEQLAVQDGRVQVQLTPTFPGCRFTPIFESEIRSRLSDVGWCTGVEVTVSSPHVIWDESRMSEHARRLLSARRARLRAELPVRR